MTESKVGWAKYETRELEITRKTKPKFDEWKSLMTTFNQMAESSPFWRGDLYNLGEEWFGANKASSIFEPETWRLKTWQNNAAVCARIEASRRREKLSYSHHAEVAYLEPDQFEDPPRPTTVELQTYYLEMAIANQFSIKLLREKIKDDKGKETPKSPLHKRLSDIVDKLSEWRHETGAEGDVYVLMTDAILKLEDAAEIQKEIEDG